MKESRQVRRARERALNKRLTRMGVALYDINDVRTLAQWCQDDPVLYGIYERSLKDRQPLFVSQISKKDLPNTMLLDWYASTEQFNPNHIHMTAQDVAVSRTLHRIWDDCEFTEKMHKDHALVVPVFAFENMYTIDQETGERKYHYHDAAQASYQNILNTYDLLGAEGQEVLDQLPLLNSVSLLTTGSDNPLFYNTVVAHEFTHLAQFMEQGRSELKRFYRKARETEKGIVKNYQECTQKKLAVLTRAFERQRLHKYGYQAPGLLTDRGAYYSRKNRGMNQQEMAEFMHYQTLLDEGNMKQPSELAVPARWADHLGETLADMQLIMQDTLHYLRKEGADMRKVVRSMVASKSAEFQRYFKALVYWDQQPQLLNSEILTWENPPANSLFSWAWRVKQMDQGFRHALEQSQVPDEAEAQAV